MARWLDQSVCSRGAIARPATVKHFIENTTTIKGKYVTHIFASVAWHQLYNAENVTLSKPMMSVYYNKFENSSAASFVPVCQIDCQVATAPLSGDHSDVLVVIPLLER